MGKYVAYKDSPVKWISRVPTHWKFIRGKNLYEKMQRPVSDTDEVVTCFRDGTVTLRKNRRTTGFTESLKEIGYQGIRNGDLVIHVMDAFAGAIGVSDSDGKGTPVYNVCRAKLDINNHYYAFLLREMARAGYIQSLYRGIRERSSDFRFEVFGAQFYPVPPRSEQDQIVRFLNWKISEINKLIAIKQKQIGYYNEKLLAVINDLSTHGVKDNRQYTITSMDWAPEIPQEWMISRIRNHFDIRKRIAGSEGYDVFSVTQQGLKVRDVNLYEGQLASNYSGYQFVYPGEFAMNHMDLLTGGVGIADHLGVTSPDYRVFGLFDEEHCYAPYYLRIFQLCYRRHAFYRFGRGAANVGRWRLPATAFKNFEIPLPPYDEQVQIVEAIEKEEEKNKAAIDCLKRQIDVLVELKKRIISDVVTGKIDVRDIEIPEYEFLTEENNTSKASETEPCIVLEEIDG